MKIRTQHVSNSSTSSYVITLKSKDKYYPLTNNDNLQQLFHDMLVSNFGDSHAFWVLQSLEKHHGSAVSNNVVDFINTINEKRTCPQFMIDDVSLVLNVDNYGSSMNSLIDCICEGVIQSHKPKKHYSIEGGCD